MADDLVTQPPAITVAALAEALVEAKALALAVHKDERNALQNAYKLGQVLAKIKEQTPHGSWLARLKDLGISRRAASRYLQLAKCKSKDVACCNSIHDAILHNKLTESEEAEVEEGKSNGPAGPFAAPSKIFCRDCRTNGPKPNCKACAEMNKPKGKPANTKPLATTAKPIFEWKDLEANFGGMVRSIDKILKVAKIGKQPEPPLAQQIRRDLNNSLDDIRKLYHDLTGKDPPIPQHKRGAR